MKKKVEETVKCPFFAPQVAESANMGAGLAALKCVLIGYHLPINEQELAERQRSGAVTLDTVAQMAREFGLEVEQLMMPVDHLLLEVSDLPVIVAMRPISEEPPYLVVVWNRFGPFLQVMDPKLGRRWLTAQSLLDELHRELIPMSAEKLQAVVGSERFRASLGERLLALGIESPRATELINMADGSLAKGLLTLDAAIRMVTSILKAGGVEQGREAEQLLTRLFTRALAEPSGVTIPLIHWSVVETPLYRGIAVLRPLPPPTLEPQSPPAETQTAPLLAASEPSILKYILADGLLTPVIIGGAVVLSALGIFLQTIIFRGLTELGLSLASAQQRVVVIGFLLFFSVMMLLFNWVAYKALFRLGQRLDIRLRLAVLSIMPHLSHQYFQNTSAGEMIEQIHGARSAHQLLKNGAQIILLFCQLGLTVIGLGWIDGICMLLAILRMVASIAMDSANGLLEAEEERREKYLGFLSRFYLDAMQGLVAVRTHGAEQAMRSKYQNLLLKWARSKLKVHRGRFWIWVADTVLSYTLITLIMLVYVARGGEPVNLLLLAYWSYNLDSYGAQLMYLLFLYSLHHGKTNRFIQLINAPKERDLLPATEFSQPPEQGKTKESQSKGIEVVMQGVSVQIAEQLVLTNIDLTIGAGSEVAIVGSSGAGKSTLVTLLLGWHYPLTGQILIDGEPLHYERLLQLRQETAWVDPSIQLWNRSLLQNLSYGGSETPLDFVIEQADLLRILERLPDNLQTSLGGEGGLLSGGEGQRVRFGRAMQRKSARLVILDEPFRGLDREKRRILLSRARSFWKGSTLICVTHDVGETLGFERVLVVSEGKIVEDGAPSTLAKQATSRYRALLEAEEAVREKLWSSEEWRHLWLEDGKLGMVQNR